MKTAKNDFKWFPLQIQVISNEILLSLIKLLVNLLVFIDAPLVANGIDDRKLHFGLKIATTLVWFEYLFHSCLIDR